MPIIRVEMWEGRTKEQKRELVEAFSEEMARITDCGIDSIYVQETVKIYSCHNRVLRSSEQSTDYPVFCRSAP